MASPLRPLVATPVGSKNIEGAPSGGLVSSLAQLRLSQHEEAFSQLGVESKEDLQDVGEDDLAALGLNKIQQNQLWQSGFAGDATATAPATGARLTISSRGTRWREQLPSPHLLRLRDYDSTWRAQRNNAEPLRRAWAPNAYQC